MDEAKLLAALARSRTAWERTRGVITVDDFSAKGARLYNEINEFYRGDADAQSVDEDILVGRLEAAIVNTSQREMVLAIVDDIYEMEVSPASVATYAIEVRRRALGLEIAQLLVKGGTRKEKIKEVITKYAELLEAEGLEGLHETETRPSVMELTQERDVGNRIPLLPGVLNKILNGGALRGHHIVVFARPEIGKSLFCINLASGALRRGFRVLWIENEDNISDLWQRFFSRLSKQPEAVLRQHPERYQQVIEDNGIDNLFIYEATPGSEYEIERKIEEHKPDVLIVNQIRNLNVKSESRTNQLEAAAQMVRNLGKKHEILTVSVTQAGDSAENEAFLGMGDVDYSNTGIPSAADLMIGLGANAAMKKQGLVMVNLPKNKISGRHESFTVLFDGQLSRVESEESHA